MGYHLAAVGMAEHLLPAVAGLVERRHIDRGCLVALRNMALGSFAWRPISSILQSISRPSPDLG
jgi:hypothetical protein